MREIRFRGKRIDNGKWVYGDLVRIPKDAGSWSEPPSQELTWHITDSRVLTHSWVEVDPETVGQYTGLKDKDGKEIYEGDIVRQTYHTELRDEHNDHEWIAFDGHHTGVVVITARGVCIKNPLHYSEDTDETKPMNAYKQVAGYRSEIIGNIYEHPQLLEGA